MMKEKSSSSNRTRKVRSKSDVDVDHKVSTMDKILSYCCLRACNFGYKHPRKSRVSTEQVIPSRKGSCLSDQTNVSILNKEVMNEDINIRVLLLPPPGNDNVWEKSIIDIHSHSGSVIVEVAGFLFFFFPFSL